MLIIIRLNTILLNGISLLLNNSNNSIIIKVILIIQGFTKFIK